MFNVKYFVYSDSVLLQETDIDDMFYSERDSGEGLNLLIKVQEKFHKFTLLTLKSFY